MKVIKVLLLTTLIVLGNINLFSKSIVLKTSDLEECFGITSFLSNNKNDIFLFSWRNHKIFKFKETGDFEKSFCRYGLGPGDIKRVLFMFYNPADDNLYLPEIASGLGRISVFDTNGKFKEYLDIELSSRQKDNILKFIFLSDGSYYTLLSERVDWDSKGKIFLTKDKITVLYFNKENRLENTVYSTFINNEMADRKGMGGPRILFSPRILVKKSSGGKICIAKNNENIIYTYNKTGKEVGKVELELKKILLSDNEFNKTKKQLVNNFPVGSRMQWLAKHMIKLKYKPIFDNFFVFQNYYIVLDKKKESLAGHTMETKLNFFDKTGKFINSRIIKGDVMNVTNSKLYIKEYDDDENEFFRIEDLTL